ncbi:hypothetical protein [Ruminococcus flavefaciens]|uniref:hypothetical protein n=1 Tax=Ruminococcus flavefaciens TaxID=1265 RepID=UPI00048F3AF2|nr:hypothetical protein [Ruminococcus flavefaciens]
MKKAITLKKAISAVLSAVTLSACVVLPTSVNQSAGKSSLVNPIVADASVLPVNYSTYHRIGKVTAELAKMYGYDLKSKSFKPFPNALVSKGTPVQILGKYGDYYLVSYAKDGMWMKKSEIAVNTKNITCKAIQPVNFTVSFSVGGGGAFNTPNYNQKQDGNGGVGNWNITFTINPGAVLEFNKEGKCVRYYGNQVFYIDGKKVTPVGSNFFFDIGGKLQLINY